MDCLSQVYTSFEGTYTFYFIFLIGVYHFFKFVLSILWNIFKQLMPTFSFKKKYNEEDSWVVVTGGTDGIGLGFCEVLAQDGCNLCIISRNQQKIKKVIQKLKKDLSSKNKHVPKFMYIVADFKNSSQVSFTENIVKKLQNIDVSVLVNNVGTSDTKNIQEFSLQQIINIINVNCSSMVNMTASLMPQMKNRKKSAIINLSSFLGQVTAPYVSLYSATKAFNTFFSEAISLEECSKNIDILSVRPMFVESPLSKEKKAFTVPDRRQCARACLRELYWEYETNGYFIHRIIAILNSIVPKKIQREVSKVMSYKKMQQYRAQ